MKTLVVSFLAVAISMSAATITLTSGFSDYDSRGLGVGPVILTVNGVPHTAFDYTLDLFASPGDTWQADLTMLPVLPSYFAGDPMAFLKDSAVTWIAQDMLGATTHARRVALQYAIYSIFEPLGPSNADSVAEVASAYSRAAGGFAPGWTFVDSVVGAKEQKQAFLYPGTTAPEPGTFVLIGTALAVIAAGIRRRRS